MTPRNNQAGMNRRRLVKSLSTAGLLAVTTGVAAGRRSRGLGGRGSDSGAEVTLSTDEFSTVDIAKIEIIDGGYRSVVGGTVDPGTYEQAYKLEFQNAPEDGEVQAASSSEEAVRHANPQLRAVDPSTSSGTALSAGTTNVGSGTESSIGGVSAQDHGGHDSESDYTGGAWMRAEDLPNWTLAQTRQTIDWETTNNDVDWVHYSYWQDAKELELPWPEGKSTWKVDQTHGPDVSWPGNDVRSVYTVDFINWNWGGHNESTEITHDVTLRGHQDGSLEWSTSQTATGEDAWLLHHHAGHYSNNPLS